MDIDHPNFHTAQGNDGIYEELMGDFDIVATRLSTSADGIVDNDTVGRIMVQYSSILSTLSLGTLFATQMDQHKAPMRLS